jgi:hypothetical protein
METAVTWTPHLQLYIGMAHYKNTVHIQPSCRSSTGWSTRVTAGDRFLTSLYIKHVGSFVPATRVPYLTYPHLLKSESHMRWR